MARAQWLLVQDCPVIQAVFTQNGQKVARTLLADTGAGSAQDPFEFVLEEMDCLMFGGKAFKTVSLGGAYSGLYPVYLISIEIPQLQFSVRVFAVGVAAAPVGFDGIACFRFLNRFTYGNFGDKNAFGLET